MAYLKPPWLTRNVFNPLAMRFGIGGAQELVTRGRRTGAPRSVPVIPVDVGGVRYLVSPRGETEWVRNLRADGAGELRGRAGAGGFQAREIPVDERGPVLGAYREKAGRAVSGLFAKLPDPADHPVFRVDPTS
jgi:deazaflavin-dependent oxidoreductase (nitroreductase family)